FFFFNDPPPAEIYTLSLHDALPISMERALAAGDQASAEIVACECVVIAETKDHLDWQLIGEAAKRLSGTEGEALKQAHEEVEERSEEHTSELQSRGHLVCRLLLEKK